MSMQRPHLRRGGDVVDEDASGHRIAQACRGQVKDRVAEADDGLNSRATASVRAGTSFTRVSAVVTPSSTCLQYR